MTASPDDRSPWHDGIVPLIHCHVCNALFDLPAPCPVCGHVYDLRPQTVTDGDRSFEMPPAFEGALHWSAHVLLRQMQLEVERPLGPASQFTGGPSQRLVVVILFWSLFESLMDRFYRVALADLPGSLSEELLTRFNSIGSRLDRLHRARWGVSFWQDLADAGFAEVAQHLRSIQEKRNAFIHGDPTAIDDALVEESVENLLAVQLGWIAVFNRRCTNIQKVVKVWQE